MGLLRRAILAPLAPLTGVLWVAEQLQRVAQTELGDRRAEEAFARMVREEHGDG